MTVRVAGVRPLPCTLNDVRREAKEKWGSSLRPFQELVCQAAIDGKDTLGVFSVGMGKSLCFQIFALLLPGTVLVVSPLIALMKDQVEGAKAKGIGAACINSSMSEAETEAIMQQCKRGEITLLYVAPERLFSPSFVTTMRILDIRVVACDEAHMCSKASSYRPAYNRIRNVISGMRRRPVVMALTATMTDAMEAEIIHAIGMKNDYTRFIGDPIRQNLEYLGQWVNSEWKALPRYLKMLHRPGRHIIYTSSRLGAEKVSKFISSAEVADNAIDPRLIGFYHAGMQRDERRRAQDRFKDGRTPVIVATTAFGMGIDVSDIRTVINFGLPGSVEDAVQMGGRAGRDGKQSEWVVLASDKSRALQERFQAGQYPPWGAYCDVWEYLKETITDIPLTQGEKFMLSEMNAKGFRKSGASYDMNAVGAVLNKLESHGAIHCRPTASSSLVTYGDYLATAPLTGFAAAVRTALFTLHGRPVSGDSTTVSVDTPVIAASMGMDNRAVTIGMMKLIEANAITKVPDFDGKSIAWNPGMEETDLSDILSQADIEERKAMEAVRLELVEDYVNVSEKRTFIKNYFAKPSP